MARCRLAEIGFNCDSVLSLEMCGNVHGPLHGRPQRRLQSLRGADSRGKQSDVKKNQLILIINVMQSTNQARRNDPISLHVIAKLQGGGHLSVQK